MDRNPVYNITVQGSDDDMRHVIHRFVQLVPISH